MISVRPAIRFFLLPVMVCVWACAPPTEYDLILRGGTILDGTGAEGVVGDVAVRGDSVAAVGDVGRAVGLEEVDVRGLVVAPGFLNIHSHARAEGLPTAVNVLSQGVTTEILNPDGGGPLDIGSQLDSLEAAGLAVNIGAFIGFNRTWSETVGPEDRRPTPEEIRIMQGRIRTGLDAGAWGISGGLDYKPGYFARMEEVVEILEPFGGLGLVFSNHDRLTPESRYSSRAGMAETIAIGEAAGLVPLITHMKVQGWEQGRAPEVLDMMEQAADRDVPVAADVYPYLRGQTSLAALILPAWAQEGTPDQVRARFRHPALRFRIVTEANEAMDARFGGPAGVYLPETGQELVDVMAELGTRSGGEAVVRILERDDPTAILRFGSEEDLEAILRHPTVSIACDCGASTAERGHPRGWGTYPRVLGRYVRERAVLDWAQAVHKMSGLPARTLGIEDRGTLRPGQAADVTVFDPTTVLDHATYENPTAPSDGIVHVLVNGAFAWRDGAATGERSGRALRRVRP